MENSAISKRNAAFGLALAVACIVNALMVVVKEKSKPVMGAMKAMTGHHWITHSVIVVILFIGLGCLLSLIRGGRGVSISPKRLINTVVSGVAVAGLIIVGFYLFVD